MKTLQTSLNNIFMNESFIMEQIGRQGLIDIVAAFYKKVPNDSILGPMYPLHDLDGAEERMRDFMLMRIGGEEDYMLKRGHPRLRARHMPFKIDTAARDRWLELMNQSMKETNVPAEVEAQLTAFFTQTADFMRNTAD